jgi:hypothetical protein
MRPKVKVAWCQCYNLTWRMRGEFIHYNKLRCFCINDKEGHTWLLKKSLYEFKQSSSSDIKSLIPLWLAMTGVKESMINVFISINYMMVSMCIDYIYR